MNILRPAVSMLALCGLSASLTAQTLMLDFGPTAASGASLTDSPYHTDGGTSAHDTWNTVTGDQASGLVSSTDDVTGVGVAVGMAGANFSTTLDLAQEVTSSNLGTQVKTGVYVPPSVGTDGILPAGLTKDDSRAVGFQVTGLLAGTYDIYILARNTSATSAYSQDVYVGTEGTAGSFDFGAYALSGRQTLSYAGGATEDIGGWVLGQNYLKFTITLASGEVLNIASVGSGGEDRGFINAVQIVSPIPEPSTYTAVVGAMALAGVITVRRRR